MWEKIKTWFKGNIWSFLLSLLIVVAFILFIAFLPKWAIITIASVGYIALLAIKIWKGKPF